jgi:hypothetical protein
MRILLVEDEIVEGPPTTPNGPPQRSVKPGFICSFGRQEIKLSQLIGK